MRPARRNALLFVLLALALLTFASDASAARSLALGVNTDDMATRGTNGVDRFTAGVGRRPALVMWYQSFSEPLFYPAQMAEMRRRRAVPLITWEPQTSSGGKVSLGSIAAGRHDAYLRRAARAARRWHRRFLVRFGHEMNGFWYPWGRIRGNSARQYRRAWRHVVRVFRRAHATNVQWVFSPNTFGYGVARFGRYYPGDRWVNWVGLDGYNWGTLRQSGWRSFRSVFQPSYRALARLTRRPMMITEAGAPEQGGDKAAWILQGLLTDLPRYMPRIRAVVWFDRDKDADWRVDSSLRSLLAFRTAVTSRLFGLSTRRVLALGRGKSARRTRRR